MIVGIPQRLFDAVTKAWHTMDESLAALLLFLVVGFFLQRWFGWPDRFLLGILIVVFVVMVALAWGWSRGQARELWGWLRGLRS